MKKVNAYIEKGNDGTYGIYMENDALDYGILGDGKTVKEAIDDFYHSYKEMKEYYNDEGKSFKEVEFLFKYDVPSFLQYYSNILSLAGLQRLTGINRKQLSHYLNGNRNPSKATIKKIENSLHEFGKEISQVSFVD